MEWQQAVALAVVAVTALLMLWGRLTQRRRGCGLDETCGCHAPRERAAGRVGPTLIVSSRKGQRPQIRERLS